LSYSHLSLWRQDLKRRTLIAGLATTFMGVSLAACGEEPKTPKGGVKEVSVEELMKPGELTDLALGPADAKVTIVEYASLTCPHCARFHKDVYPEVKKKYIDTGKVRFVFRDFPLNPRAFGASMLARCLGGDKAIAMIETLFHSQADWAFAENNAQQKLFDVVKQAGFTQESFEKCLTDQKLFEQLTAMQARASDVFGVNATPTFFVNGKKLDAPTLEEFDKALEPLVGKG
jgi:protein-disulfide isomerase